MRMGKSAPGPALWVEEGGSGTPVLVLLHGMGANAAVWDGLKPLLERHWPGRWLAPDLRGHGRSEHRAPYSLGAHAADVAGLLPQGEEAVVLGHSMGGAVAMMLGTGWFGVNLRHVIAFGVKLAWSVEEARKALELARAPVRWFATREEALDRHLRVCGLKGLIDPVSPAALLGIAEESGRFRLAGDPAISGVVGVDLGRVAAAMRSPLRLAAGERDPMVTAEQMHRLDPQAVLLAGLGHNPHVEAPAAVWRLVEEALAQPTRSG
jgi:pimeloyl-ACP methyl ester carboxylesterase